MIPDKEIQTRLDDLQREKDGLIQQRQGLERQRNEMQEQDQNIIQRLVTIDGGLFELQRLLSFTTENRILEGSKESNGKVYSGSR